MVPDAAALQEIEVWRALALSRAGLERFVRTAQSAVGLRGEVEVLLADDRTLCKLNREWRGKNKATDVLSFPAASELAGIHAGDLAVSLETAARQADEHGHALRDEVRVLLLHGLLHLAGMDHEIDDGEMAAREGELRARLRLKSGLIARVEGEQTPGSKAPSSRRVMRPEAKASGYLDAKAPGDSEAKAVAGTRKQIPYGNDKKKSKKRVRGVAA
jgi:probable rRNA maturation factor